jgi:hypothetical protein
MLKQEAYMSQAEKEKLIGVQEDWPDLPYEAWKDTYTTLHLWTQIVGRVRSTLSPKLNHWWHNTLYVTPRGLTTSPIPYDRWIFELQLDLIDHHLTIQTSAGQTRFIALYPRSVADFYRELMAILGTLGIQVGIDLLPHKPLEPIRYDQDVQHASYDTEYIERFRLILIQVDRVFKEFRGRFVGKCSPVHFWPGSFDLAVARFSGRRVGSSSQDGVGDDESSFESSSAGFWPGSASLQEPAFYAYTTPAPAGIEKAGISPNDAYFDKSLGEFILRYEDVRKASIPGAMLSEFLQSTYAAGADLAGWERRQLESLPVSQ